MKKILRLVLLTAMFLLVMGAANTTVQAKRVGYSYSRLPKRMRGTWYTYTNFGYGKKKIYKLHMTNKNLRKYKKHKVYIGKKARKTAKYWTATQTGKIHGYRWIHTYGWQQTAGAGDYFNLHKFGKHQVLTTAGGAGVWDSTNYYRSKRVAKKMTHKRYPGFKYGY
ncbi:hypothetical protein D1831_00695 [Lactiplantibacillus garii]|uniref:Uncharacterized protein n=1 Tax=Lactiplantibacillus garii TaxID=2306423 RepID=A0A3R8QTM6_9LACO|nr:hypothetical protein [Lactiplantibacillus garii]RRK11891.1 hypothetical protein D1831_00695 [Lactiplantibacillus garii]